MIAPDVSEYLPALAKGVAVTLIAAFGSNLVGTVLALFVGLLRVSPMWPLRWVAIAFIEFFRGTSLLVQVFWWYYVLPIFGVVLSAWAVAIIALGMNFAGYGAELVRAAIQSIDHGQYDASIALNFPRLAMMRRILLPQAIRTLLPQWGNMLIDGLKSTSLLFFISISELTSASLRLASLTGDYLLFLAVALFAYYLIARVVITPGVRWLERRFSRAFVREATV